MSRPTLLRSLASFSSMTMVSRVLGLMRDMVISGVFGVSAATDAWNVAFRIPNFLRRLFAEGSFATAFVPVLTEAKETRTPQDVRELIARTAGTLGGVLLLVTALGVLFAPQILAVFVPGSADDSAKFGLTVDLLRLTFPFLLFVSLTALAGGVLNTYHRFALPAVTPVILNLCMIAGALWLAPRLAVPIAALGWAILVAGLLQLLLQLPALRGLNMLALPRWGWNHPGVRKTLRLMVPTLFGSSVAQINLLFDTVIASFLITGSQTWLPLSDRLLELPLGVFGVALGTVILPSLARHHVGTDKAGFSRALDWGLRVALLIAIPASLGLAILAEPIVATLFQHDRFTAYDTRMTALSLSALSLGLPAFALVKILLPAFYARQDTATPVRAGVASLLANMVLNVVFLALLFALWHRPGDLADGWLAGLSRVPGLHMALGAASALASYLNLLLLWRYLRRADVYSALPGWGRHWLQLGLASAAMVGVLLAGHALWPEWDGVAPALRALRLAALVTAGGIAYGLVLLALGLRPRDLRGT